MLSQSLQNKKIRGLQPIGGDLLTTLHMYSWIISGGIAFHRPLKSKLTGVCHSGLSGHPTVSRKKIMEQCEIEHPLLGNFTEIPADL